MKIPKEKTFVKRLRKQKIKEYKKLMKITKKEIYQEVLKEIQSNAYFGNNSAVCEIDNGYLRLEIIDELERKGYKVEHYEDTNKIVIKWWNEKEEKDK